MDSNFQYAGAVNQVVGPFGCAQRCHKYDTGTRYNGAVCSAAPLRADPLGDGLRRPSPLLLGFTLLSGGRRRRRRRWTCCLASQRPLDTAGDRRRRGRLTGIGYAETRSPSLVAYRARLADPAWFRADFSGRPPIGSGAGHRTVARQIAFGSLCLLTLAAQLLHAGTYRCEVVGEPRSVHVFLLFA